MVLETFFPEQLWPFEKIDKIIRKEEGKYVWPETFWPTLIEAGVHVHDISSWDNSAFLARRWDYMREKYGEEFTQLQIEQCPDFDFILACLHRIEKESDVTKEMRPATLQDIEHHLSNGAYVEVQINPRALRGAEGVLVHAVLIYGLDEKNIYWHNPGWPPKPEEEIPVASFLKAWSFGKEENRTLTAYSKRSAPTV